MVCNRNVDSVQGTARAQVVLGFRQSGIFEMLTTFASDAQAESAIAEIQAAFASCVEWSQPLASQRLASYRPSRLDQFPAVGDQSAAFSVAIAVAPPRVTGTDHVMAVRRGRAVMFLSFLTPGLGDLAQTLSLVQHADQKLQAVVAGISY